MFKFYKKNDLANAISNWIIIDDDFEEQWDGTWSTFNDIYKKRGLKVIPNIILFLKHNNMFNEYSFKRAIKLLPEYEEELGKYMVLL